MKDIFPAKNTVDKLGDEIQYSQKLINVIEKEVGTKILTVLEHAGVFKRDKTGQTAFDNFIVSLGVRKY